MLDRHTLHSRLVLWLKILLPLTALAILSTLFLFSRQIDPSDAIPYAEVDVGELAREPRVTAPNYSGVTSDGAAVTVTAASARPDPSDAGRADAVDLRAVIDATGGTSAELVAAAGVIDTNAGLLTLSGGVRIATSDGYTVTADSLTSALTRTEVIAIGPLDAVAPFGTLRAGGMTLTADPALPGGNVLVFNDGVKLVYDPKQ